MNQEFVQAAATHSVRAVMRYLGTRLTGLSSEEVETQRSTFGVNKVTREKKKSIARRLVGAFVNPFTMILFVLALVSTATDMIFPAFELFGSARDDFDPLTVIITVMVAISGGECLAGPWVWQEEGTVRRYERLACVARHR